MTAKSVIASAKRLIDVRQRCSNSSRMAEMNVPGVADPDPPDEVGDGERPGDRDVVAPQADARSRPSRSRTPAAPACPRPVIAVGQQPAARLARPDRRQQLVGQLGVGRVPAMSGRSASSYGRPSAELRVGVVDARQVVACAAASPPPAGARRSCGPAARQRTIVGVAVGQRAELDGAGRAGCLAGGRPPRPAGCARFSSAASDLGARGSAARSRCTSPSRRARAR